MKKVNLSDESLVRTKVMSGIDKMADLVSLTLGPAGRSILIERGVGEPLIVDDGRRVAENIKLDDNVEQLAVRVAYGVTRKTDEKAGDGTTTAMVLTRAILKDIYKERLTPGIGVHANVNDIDAEIQKAKNEAIALLDKEAKPVKTQKDLEDVATVIAGNPSIGKTIAEMYWKLGKEGHICMEFNLLSENIETEVVPGYRFSGGYAAQWMINNAITRTWEMNDVDVLVVNQKINDVTEIEPIANIIGNQGKSTLVVIAKGFHPSVLKFAYQNGTRKNSPFLVMCVRAPSRTEEAYKDMAIFTGAKYFGEGDDLKTATKEDLGHVRSITVSDDTTIMTEGRGKKSDIDKRVKEVLAEVKLQKLHQFKQDRLERASALTGGVGVIRIGAPTDEERNWLKYKIEDAKHGTKHAFREGIVQGGGLTFKKISESLPDSNILKTALLAPYEVLKSNAGGKLVVGKNVFDAVVVEKAALEHACSAVSKLIRIGGAIAYAQTPTIEEAFKPLLANEPQEDYGIQDDGE